jgi:hypothetical protein
VLTVIAQLQERAESEKKAREKNEEGMTVMPSMKGDMGIPSEVTLPRKLARDERLIGCDASISEFWAWATQMC